MGQQIAETARTQQRSALIDVATRLIREAGPGAVTTRAVAAEAGVQAPTIYRLFGDKDGLLDAVAEHAFAGYIGESGVTPADEPIEDLHRGWRSHIEFGLANPALFTLLTDPDRGASPAAVAGFRLLRNRVHRVAAIGRLRVPEARAVELIHAAGTGTVLTLNAVPAPRRETALADQMYEAVTRIVLTDAPAASAGGPVGPVGPVEAVAAAAVTLRAAAPDLEMLSGAERTLLADWLDRITG